MEHDFRAYQSETTDETIMEETQTARCGSCGAEVEFEVGIHSDRCPFCASAIVVETGLNRHVKPQGQLPFLVSEETARAALREWLGRLWFAPSDIRRQANTERVLEGVYVPYWTYNADTRTTYRGQRGTLHQQTRRIPVLAKGKRRMRTVSSTKVRWRSVRGRVSRAFQNVLVPGTKSLPRRFSDGIGPWDLSALIGYDSRYLAGFRSEAYTVPVSEAFGDAQEIMKAVITQDIRCDIGGDRQRVVNMDTDLGRVSFKHILLPVWIAAYRYRGTSYRFAVNGRTGIVEGQRPWSPVKIAIAIVVACILAAGVAFVFYATN
ncbi:MAG: primosomal protein N' (replication factor Y) - superfamily II helicase [Pseudomonadota bacterium]